MYFRHLLKPGEPQIANSALHSAPQDGVPHQITLKSKEPGTAPAHSWVAGFSSLLACKIIQTSQAHPSMERRRRRTSSYYKAASHSPCHFLRSLVYNNFHGVWCVPHDMMLSGLWARVINCCCSHLSGVRCHVFGHPQNPGMEILPHQWNTQEAPQTSVLVLFACISYRSLPPKINQNTHSIKKEKPNKHNLDSAGQMGK